MRRFHSVRLGLAAVSMFLGGAAGALLGTCGPFSDVAGDAFCPFVLEVFYAGITTGTTATTYDPTSNVSRLQMAIFLSRAVDGVLRRGSRRAALDQYWTSGRSLGSVTVGVQPQIPAFDGEDVWVPAKVSNTVTRVRGASGKLLETWTGAVGGHSALAVMWNVFVTGDTVPGRLYRIDPSQPAGAVTTVATNLGDHSHGIAFDGSRIWTANVLGSSVSIVTPGDSIPWTVTTVTSSFNTPEGLVFDGANVWETDYGPGLLQKLDASGAVLQTVTVGAGPEIPVFDGNNIWVPNSLDATVSVIKASSGAVLATLTGNGLSQPINASFDGQRVLVTNLGGTNVSLWKAADLTSIGNFPVGQQTAGACNDGVGFFVTGLNDGKLVRY